MRNSKEIELFGVKLSLYERNASDVMALASKTIDPGDNLEAFAISVQILVDSLNYNIHVLKWWQISKRIMLNRIISLRYIVKNLTPREIMEFTAIIRDLEGNDKKKVPEVPLSEGELLKA